MNMHIVWTHEAAQAASFYSLMPKAIDATQRWCTVQGVMQKDEFGFYYNVKVDVLEAKADMKKFWVLRPVTLRLGVMKALQDAPDHWAGWYNELEEIFENMAKPTLRDQKYHDPAVWSDQALDFVVQLAWFREVMFT